jgi:hypothetical protein
MYVNSVKIETIFDKSLKIQDGLLQLSCPEIDSSACPKRA